MNISEKLQSIAQDLVAQVVQAVHEELVNTLQTELAALKGNGLRNAHQYQMPEMTETFDHPSGGKMKVTVRTAVDPLPTRTPITADEKAEGDKEHKVCRHPGCIGVAVPRYRNFCKDHKDDAAAESKSLKRRKRRKAKKE